MCRHVRKYWQYQGDLSIGEDLLLKGVRVVIPASYQQRILQLLHNGHQGIGRCKSLARESVWWPGINSQIETMVMNCSKCAETRVQRAEPMLVSETPTGPWEVVGIDLFHLKGGGLRAHRRLPIPFPRGPEPALNKNACRHICHQKRVCTLRHSKGGLQ